MLSRRDVLKIVWDSYSSDMLPAEFDEVVREDGSLTDMVDDLGDGLITFLLREIAETYMEMNTDKETLDVVLRTMESVEKDVALVREGLEEAMAEIKE